MYSYQDCPVVAPSQFGTALTSCPLLTPQAPGHTMVTLPLATSPKITLFLCHYIPSSSLSPMCHEHLGPILSNVQVHTHAHTRARTHTYLDQKTEKGPVVFSQGNWTNCRPHPLLCTQSQPCGLAQRPLFLGPLRGPQTEGPSSLLPCPSSYKPSSWAGRWAGKIWLECGWQ